MIYKSEREACEAWVGGFRPIPIGQVVRAHVESDDALTLIAGGDRHSDCCDEGVNFLPDDIEGEGEPVRRCSDCQEECETHWTGAHYGWPSAWGMLYHPSEPLDASWVRNHADEIADTCGLLVYDSDEAGVLLAVDGAGYDFYARHWLPLYRLRGLEWHK